MEMWVSRTPFLKGRVLKNGRPTGALVRFAVQGTDSEGTSSWAELRGELEVALPGGGTNVLRGLFNGHKKMAPHVFPQMQLPVKLHPNDDGKLVIDWKAWEAEGGLAAAKARGDAGEALKANAMVRHGSGVVGGPSAAPMSVTEGGGTGGALPAWAQTSMKAWGEALAAGNMTQEEYDQDVADVRRSFG